jgi:predicted AlkP superfamily pyrophosphatase or phosphodiesterase
MRPAAALLPLAVLTAAVTGVALFALSRPVEPVPAPSEPRVKLAVLVVFDQMRGDYLQRWGPLFRADGFARLQRDGAWFTNCHYPYATTTTGPGHASVLTGTCADRHGIVNNNWWENGAGVYCAGSTDYQFVPPLPEAPARDEKADKKKPEVGTPERLLSETVADVLKRETGGKAKVFGLSLKDRSAILPTGRRPDGVFWFHGAFRTSTYYTGRKDVPVWVERFNVSKVADRWFGKKWERLRSGELYDAAVGPDVQPGEGKGVNQGVEFPHPTTGLKPGEPLRLGAKYYEALANSPFGNDLLLEFAKTCVIEEKLGTGAVPDLLVISFSSNDLIGHTWGPDSHEVLDVTLRSDLLMADLLAFLDERVGKGRYALAVTADHGICPLPEVTREKWRREGRTDWQEARRVDPGALQKELDAHLAARFPTNKAADGKTAPWVDAFAVPWPWVDLKESTLKASGLPRERVAAEAATFLAAQPGVARAFTRSELMGPISPSDEIAMKMKRSFHPARCGDVGVVLKPYCIPSGRVEAKTKGGWEPQTGTTHGAPYDYDTHVPLFVYGPGVRGGERDEPTTPQALAPIFAKWLNVPPPKDAEFPIPTTLRE